MRVIISQAISRQVFISCLSAAEFWQCIMVVKLGLIVSFPVWLRSMGTLQSQHENDMSLSPSQNAPPSSPVIFSFRFYLSAYRRVSGVNVLLISVIYIWMSYRTHCNILFLSGTYIPCMQTQYQHLSFFVFCAEQFISRH